MARLRERLGNTVRVLRERRLGVSQERLAHDAGLDEKFLGEVERAEKSAGVETLERIADGLRMPLWEVVRAAEALPELMSESPAAPPVGGQRQKIPERYPQGQPRTPLVPAEARSIAGEPPIGPALGSAGTSRFLVIIQQTGAGYSAHVPDLPGCYASADSAEAIESGIRSAIASHLQQLRAADEKPPAMRSYAMIVESPISQS